jgi:hypothetical protein
MRPQLLIVSLALMARLCTDRSEPAPVVLDAGVDAGSGGAAGAPTKHDAGTATQRCPGSNLLLRVGLYQLNAYQLARTPVTTHVTVTGADPCDQVDCGAASPSTRTTRYALTDDGGGVWYLLVEFAALPTGLLQVGESFDMQLESVPDGLFYYVHNQTVILSRNGSLVFAYVGSNLSAPDLKSFDAYGLHLAAGEVVCEDSPSTSCGHRVQALNVSSDDASLSLAPGEVQTVAGVSLTLALYDQNVDRKWCDAGPRFVLGAFAQH